MVKLTKMYIACVDLGGTKISLGIVNLKGKILKSRTLPTPVRQAPAKVLIIIAGEIKKLLAGEKISTSQIKGLGIGVPGQVLPEKGLVVSSPNLPRWKNFQIKKPLEKLLKIPVFLDNDAKAAALGELYFGAGQGQKDFLYVTVSTGIGCGIVLGGRIYRGAKNIAGEVGHMIIMPGGPKCGCGSRGCWEALASGKSFARLAREKLKNYRGRTILFKMTGGQLNRLGAKMLDQAVRQNDAFAKKIWQEAVNYLGIGFVNLVNIFNPPLIIVGGGLSKAGNLIFEPIKKIVGKMAYSVSAQSVKIVPAQLKENSGLLGAAGLVMAGRN